MFQKTLVDARRVAPSSCKHRLDDHVKLVDDNLIVRPLVATLVYLHHAVEHRRREGAVPDVVGLRANLRPTAPLKLHRAAVIRIGAERAARRREYDAARAIEAAGLSVVDD